MGGYDTGWSESVFPKGPGLIETWLNQAEQAVVEKSFYTARDFLERVLRESPDNPRALALYGYVLAMGFRVYEKGLGYVQRAIEQEIYRPQWYVYAAQIYLRMGDRRKAIVALDTALRWDPRHSPALELRKKMGIRRPPVIPFLPRSHPVNIWLGKLRHRLWGRF